MKGGMASSQCGPRPHHFPLSDLGRGVTVQIISLLNVYAFFQQMLSTNLLSASHGLPQHLRGRDRQISGFKAILSKFPKCWDYRH